MEAATFWATASLFLNTMRIMIGFWAIPLMLLMGCGDDNNQASDNPSANVVELSPADLQFVAAGEENTIIVKSNAIWTLKSDGQTWYSLSAKSGFAGEMAVKIVALKNYTDAERTAVLSFASGTDYKKEYRFKQAKGVIENYVPEGYTLVWQDEFNEPCLNGGKPALPNTSEWWYEVAESGWVNNELQRYIADGVLGTDTCSVISDGVLKIIAKKVGDQVISARMNTNKSWTYGYFEARLKLPKGKGTWPAFWMMPKNGTAWPDDGEIDIMEEVGYDPNVIHSTVHSKAYNHTVGTQKAGQKTVPTSQTDFHIYAVEWSEGYIKGYVDGECYFTFNNDKTGNRNTWPFNAPFYLKLNLAWGGDWGGAQGVDESALPATYEIDYVRVYQKK